MWEEAFTHLLNKAILVGYDAAAASWAAPNISCIYSTLKFVAIQALMFNVTPLVKFDQPLFWKVLNIIRSQQHRNEVKQIVLRLEPFHMQMSCLGSICHLMVELVCPGNTVTVMIPG